MTIDHITADLRRSKDMGEWLVNDPIYQRRLTEALSKWNAYVKTHGLTASLLCLKVIEFIEHELPLYVRRNPA